MKRCPQCNRVETDEALKFCRVDGTTLVSESSGLAGEAGTAQLGTSPDPHEVHTSILPHDTLANGNRATGPTTALPAQPSRAVTEQLSKKRRPKVLIAIAVVFLVCAIAAGFFIARPYLSAKRTSTIESIAVMPFVNESGNADVEYLSDGMTKTLISSLSQLPNLNVKPRSSVFRYKNKETNAQTIGKELKVQAVLNGRVVQRGQELSLFVELIDIALDKVVWSQQYNRKQSDLVSLQSEIARDVSNKLKSKLSGAEVAKIGKTYTADPEAYQLFLKGRFQWNKRTGESLKQAVGFFNQAIEEDPNYALAYSGLAESYVLFPNYSVALPMESMPRAKAAAVSAIELDDSLAEAHVALGIYLSVFSWNQPAAEREFRRAIELNPNYPTAHQQLANFCLTAMGRFDESFVWLEKDAMNRSPRPPLVAFNPAFDDLRDDPRFRDLVRRVELAKID